MLRALAFALCLAGLPAFAETVTVETFRGPQETAQSPQTIAVFDIAALDTLTALGVQPDGVISNLYVSYLERGAAQVVGTLFEPDFEALAALDPDLIIAGGRSHEAVPSLAKLAPTVDMTIWGDTVTQGLARLEAFGQIFAREAEAAALKQALLAKIDDAKAAVAGKGSAMIVMTNGTKVSAYGGSGRFGWMHKALALPEAIPDLEQTTHGEAISFEFIRDANPDILIVIDRLAAIGQDGDGAKATLDNALMRETKAWKSGQVIYLDSASTYVASGGVQALNLFFDQVIAAFGKG